MFRTHFFQYKNNFYLEKIFDNPNFGTGRGMQVKFDAEFFGNQLFNQNLNSLQRLTWQQLIVNGEFVRFDDFELFAEFRIDMRRYNLLRNCFNNLKKKFGGEDEDPIEISNFFRKIKKGSKSFRSILEYSCPKKLRYINNSAVKSFCKIEKRTQ